MPETATGTLEALRAAARPLTGHAGDYDELLDLVGDARVVLLGEATVGVVYLPRSERASHYFHALLAEQFDAVVHVDETRAVEPLEPSDEWHAGEPPETFPTGL